MVRNYSYTCSNCGKSIVATIDDSDSPEILDGWKHYREDFQKTHCCEQDKEKNTDEDRRDDPLEDCTEDGID